MATPHTGRFVAYYRVSTDKQRNSGLGLEAQRAGVAGYLNGGKWKLVGEFEEIESGRRSDRPELDKALAACRLHKAKLIVAKVDRLTRSAAFLSRLLESGVDVLFCDLPQIEGPTGKFLLQQMASVAELEAGMISVRTKAALAAAKARGKTLGGNRGARLTAEQSAMGRSVLVERANRHAADVAETVKGLQSSGVTSLAGIAAALNERGIPTASGRGVWQAVQVSRVLARIRA
jgi:DNA invertase Pin-like site-specific DNA recombinase